MMPTRRDMLRAAGAAGIAFCGCSMLPAAVAGAQTLPVRVKGRTVRTVDIHAHCFIPEAIAMVDAQRQAVMMAPAFGATNEQTVLQSGGHNVLGRLATMDSQAIDMEVLSINPFWYGDTRDLAAAIVRVQNEKLAELCGAYPKRFAAFASLTLQHPELAVEELEHAIRRQGLRGAAIGGHVNGVNFSDRRFDPVWAKAEELGAMLYIHPADLRIAELDKRLAGNGVLTNLIGNPLGTTIALSHLIFEGTLDRFPRLKVCGAHGGGYLPSYAARSDHMCHVAPCDPSVVLKKQPTDYLKQIFYDSLVFTPEALRHLVAEVGASQVMIGTDIPYPWQAHPVDHVMATPLTDDEKIAILGGNAARELRL